jgi:DNA-binding MarR family transcriptional regulator
VGLIMRIAQTETAIDAFHAHHASGKASAQQTRILDHIKACGGHWSIGELAHVLGMEKSTVSGRVRELLDAGSIEEKPRRKDRQSGVKVRPVGLPAEQAELFN